MFRNFFKIEIELAEISSHLVSCASLCALTDLNDWMSDLVVGLGSLAMLGSIETRFNSMENPRNKLELSF